MSEVVAAAIFVIPALLGVRATWRLWRIYAYNSTTRRQSILLAFALIASVITASAIYFGFLSVRRLLGFEALPWVPAGSVVVAGVVLLIPTALERLVLWIGKREPGD